MCPRNIGRPHRLVRWEVNLAVGAIAFHAAWFPIVNGAEIQQHIVEGDYVRHGLLRVNSERCHGHF
jgi:hypothetical protein